MTITLTQVREAVETLARERPDERNPDACVYTDFETGRHCAVGEVLLSLELELPDATTRGANTNYPVNSLAVYQAHQVMNWPLEVAALTYLSIVQPFFDKTVSDAAETRVTWGEGFAAYLADREPERLP